MEDTLSRFTLEDVHRVVEIDGLANSTELDKGAFDMVDEMETMYLE